MRQIRSSLLLLVVLGSIILCAGHEGIDENNVESTIFRKKDSILGSEKPEKAVGVQSAPRIQSEIEDGETNAVDSKVENNCTDVNNSSECGGNDKTYQLFDKMKKEIKENKGMLMRTGYVLTGITLIIIIYFGFKALRKKRRMSKSKKYGVLATADNDLEMAPLDADDEDEDMTVFEVNRVQHK